MTCIFVDHPSVVPLAENPNGTGQRHQQNPRTRNQNAVVANAKTANALGKKRRGKREENAKSGDVGHEATTIQRKKSAPEKETVTGGARVKVAHAARVRVLRPRLLVCRRVRKNGSKSLLLPLRLSWRRRATVRCHHRPLYHHMARTR